MNDYTKIIEHMKLSEIRVASVTKEIKAFEGCIKKIDEEIEINKAKEKQLAEELGYKRKIVTEKEWELAELQRVYSIWENMLKDKQTILDTKKDDLDAMQNKVWNTRRSFHEKANEFLLKHNFLVNINTRIEVLIQKNEEKQKLFESIEILDMNVNSLEKTHSELKANWDLMQHLEKERESLLEYEFNPDVLRLQNKIANLSKELDSVEKELWKYSERATMTPEDILAAHNYYKETSGPAQPHDGGDMNRAIPNYVTRNCFKQKMPSFLIVKPSFNNDAPPRKTSSTHQEE